MRTAAVTSLALVAFAANSILCRLALAGGESDAVSFTAVRLASGALVLALLVRARGGSPPVHGAGSFGGAAALLAYAAAFSLAYLSLPAGTGALVLFGAVQATMIGGGWLRGHRPRPAEWAGLLLAAAGFVLLVLPGLARPDLLGVALMALAGAAWGVYSLLGRGAARPLAATADNFLRTMPAVAVLAAWGAVVSGLETSPTGLLLAGASGALASGVGYALWYAALPALSPARGAVVQLLVPVLAAAGGVALLGETVTGRLFVAGAAILAGVVLATFRVRRASGTRGSGLPH